MPRRWRQKSTRRASIGTKARLPSVPARVATRKAGKRHRQAKPLRKEASQGSRSGAGRGRTSTRASRVTPRYDEGGGVEAEGEREAARRLGPGSRRAGAPAVQARVRTNCRREFTTTRARSVASSGQPRLEPGVEGDGQAARPRRRRRRPSTPRRPRRPQASAEGERRPQARPRSAIDQESAQRRPVEEHAHGEAEEQGGYGLQGGGEAQIERRPGEVDDEERQRQEGDVVAEEGGGLAAEDPEEVAAGGGRLGGRAGAFGRSWAARIPARTGAGGERPVRRLAGWPHMR